MLPFEDYCSILISGISQSGKTTWVHKLCQHADVMFRTPVDNIIYVYKHFQPSFQQLQDQVKNITFTSKVPSESELQELTSDSNHTLLILDDAFNMLYHGDGMCQSLVTRLGHHFKLSTIFATQSTQAKNKAAQSIMKNIHNIVIMSCAREAQFVKNLGVQLGQYNLMKQAFNHVCEVPYRYLLVGLHPKRDRDLRFSSNIFPNEVTRIYLSKDQDQ